MNPFQIFLFRGDTKKITASLSIDGQDADLTGYSVKMFNAKEKTVIATAMIDGALATFDINKGLSAALPPRPTAVMIVFESNVQRVSQPGVLYVSDGVVNV